MQGRLCSGSEAGLYLRLIDFVDHSTLGLRLIKKKQRIPPAAFDRVWYISKVQGP